MYFRHASEEDSCVSSEQLHLVLPLTLVELADRYMSTALDTTSRSVQLLFRISTHSAIRLNAAGGAFEEDRDLAAVLGLRCVQPTCPHIVVATSNTPVN